MDYITTTELRTKSSQIIAALSRGHTLNLIHRSKIVAEIKPTPPSPKPLTQKDINQLRLLAKKINLPKLSYQERDKRYTQHLMKKYGQGVS